MTTGQIIVGFAGFGGMCQGFLQATGRSPTIAVNHWPHAIKLHALNHPQTRHYCEDVHQVDIRAEARADPVWWIHISPDCTHFSRAKGAKPRLQHIRALAWILVDWAKATGATVISLENVREFLGWGPLDEHGCPITEREGEEFRRFIAALADPQPQRTEF